MSPSSPTELRKRYPLHVTVGELEKKGDVFGAFHAVEAEGYLVRGEGGGIFLAIFKESTQLVRRVLKMCKPCQERKDAREFLLYEGTGVAVQAMVFRTSTPEARASWVEGLNRLWERHLEDPPTAPAAAVATAAPADDVAPGAAPGAAGGAQ
jgi:hypothetical protein